MKQFFDWFFENRPSAVITKKDNNNLILNGFQDRETIEMAFECGCNGISADTSYSIKLQFN